MAKTAATEDQVGVLHKHLTAVFTALLKKYKVSLDVIKDIEQEDDPEKKLELLLMVPEPNPAMLTAVANFLKSNDIGFSREELDDLSEQEALLMKMRKSRPKRGLEDLLAGDTIQ